MPMTKVGRHSSITWGIITTLFVVLIGINTYIARSTVQELNALQSDIRNTGDVMVALDELHISLITAQSGQRGFLLTRQERSMLHYRDALADMDKNLSNARALKSDIPGQQALIIEVTRLIEKMLIT